MMRRGVLLSSLWAMALLAVAWPLVAATSADIAIGGGLVARIREKGPFPSIEARAAHIDKQLVEVVSNEDTLHPQVSLKQDKSGRWTVYAWRTAVISVFPAESKANGLSEKQMGAIWAANLKKQLPLATPCSKLPPEMLGYGKAGAAKPATPKTVPASTATVVAQAPVPAAPVAAAKPVTTTAVTGASESGALLLIVDAMRTAREMDEQSWVAQKEAMSRNLYSDLSYYLTGKGAPPPLPATKPVAAAVKPVTAKPATATTAVAKPATAAAPVTKPVTAAAPATKPATSTTAAKPAAPKTDPSMAKVPQKNRIRAKFALAKPAYDKLAAGDAAAAEPVNDLLAESRQAFAKGDFDESERLVDEALKALGVEYKP
jgi:hypothetical protein